MSLGMGSQLDSNGVPLADRSLGCLPIRRRLNRNRTPAQPFLPSFRAIAACASGLPLSWLPATPPRRLSKATPALLGGSSRRMATMISWDTMIGSAWPSLLAENRIHQPHWAPRQDAFDVGVRLSAAVALMRLVNQALLQRVRRFARASVEARPTAPVPRRAQGVDRE